MAQFRFVMRSGPAAGKVFPLEAPDISIGRDSTNTIVINDAEVSRRHARMDLRGAAYVIQDLGSTNGTFVNGARIRGIQVLNSGDTVAFGEGIVLAYEAAVDVNATILSEKTPQTIIQKSAPAPAPVPVPAPTPAPVPAPAFSGQVPAGPIPMPAAATPKKKKFPVWLIIVIALLLILCVCVGVFVIIDQLNLWCKAVPFLVPLFGGAC
jgi:predicted component of type VI protein secretion system